MKRLLHIPTARYWMGTCSNNDTVESIITTARRGGWNCIGDSVSFPGCFLFAILAQPIVLIRNHEFEIVDVDGD